MPSIPSLATGLALSSIAAAIVLINGYEKPQNSASGVPTIDSASMKCFVAGSFSDPKLFLGGAQSIDSMGRSHDKAGNYLMSFTNTEGGTTNIGTGVRIIKNGDGDSHWNEKIDITQDNGFSIVAKTAFQGNTAGVMIAGANIPSQFITSFSPSSSYELGDGQTKVEVVSNTDLKQYFSQRNQNYSTDAVGLNVTQKLLSGGSLRTLILWHSNATNPYLDVVSEASDGDPGFIPNRAFGSGYTPNPDKKACPVNPPPPSPQASSPNTVPSPTPEKSSQPTSPQQSHPDFKAGAAM